MSDNLVLTREYPPNLARFQYPWHLLEEIEVTYCPKPFEKAGPSLKDAKGYGKAFRDATNHYIGFHRWKKEKDPETGWWKLAPIYTLGAEKDVPVGYESCIRDACFLWTANVKTPTGHDCTSSYRGQIPPSPDKELDTEPPAFYHLYKPIPLEAEELQKLKFEAFGFTPRYLFNATKFADQLPPKANTEETALHDATIKILEVTKFELDGFEIPQFNQLKEHVRKGDIEEATRYIKSFDFKKRVFGEHKIKTLNEYMRIAPPNILVKEMLKFMEAQFLFVRDKESDPIVIAAWLHNSIAALLPKFRANGMVARWLANLHLLPFCMIGFPVLGWTDSKLVEAVDLDMKATFAHDYITASYSYTVHYSNVEQYLRKRNMNKPCWRCLKRDCTARCKCGLVRYCSTECQKADWKDHKPFCLDNRKPDDNVFYVEKKQVVD